jgi:hypothetical protein
MASRRLGVALLTGALVVAPLRVAHADPSAADRETARSLMEEARELRDKNDLRGALDRFQRADAIMQVPTTGYELAQTQVSLGLLVEARDTIVRVLHTAGGPREPAPFRAARKNAQALNESLQGRIPGLTIVVHGAPAGETPTVAVDDVEVPSAALGVPRRVDPGHHVVTAKTASAEGRAEVDVQEGQTKEVPVALVAAPVKPVPAVETPPVEETAPPPEPAKRSHTLTYLGFGLGVVGVAVGSVTGLMALSKKSALTSECNASGHCPASAFGDVDSANTLATVSTIAFVAGGFGVAVGVVSLFLGGSSEKKDAAPAQARVEPWIGAGFGGVRGQF